MGRPRKQDVIRDAKGKSRGETEGSIKAVVWAQRAKERGVGIGDPLIDEPLAGYCLGRLKLAGKVGDICGISTEQYDAGWEYAKVVRSHASIMGYSLGVKAAALERGGGLSTKAELEDEEIFKIRRKFNDCYRALMDAGLAILQDVLVATQTYDVCLDRIQFNELAKNERMVGNVKVGLNALARQLR